MQPAAIIRPHIDAATEIGNLYEQGGRALIEVGKRLLAQKKRMPHGVWISWLDTNERQLGFGRFTAARLMKLANVAPGATFDLWGHNTRGTQGTGENEWYTPAKYIELARTVLGEIDLDPASSDIAQKVIKAGKYFTAQKNGLLAEWSGRIWLNPPYAQPLIYQFVSKMIQERSAGRVDAGIMLTHNYTDTAWFQEAVEIADAICFTRGRIKFIDAEGDECAPTQGQAFFYFGNNTDKFTAKFLEIGFVVVPSNE